LFLSVVTIFELENVARLLERKTPSEGANLRRWLEHIKLNFRMRVLPYALKTATVCAALHVPNPRPERDAMIAASAIAHKFTNLTRNVPDIANTRVNLINRWQTGCHSTRQPIWNRRSEL